MFKVGIIGAGWIADKMAEALSPLKDYCVYAIASRSIEKAEEFAQRWNVAKAYGSYEEMVDDKDVDLVYIATPHSHHFPHTMLALEHGKHVLVEKAFTANAAEAEILIRTAHEKGLFITEAIWTRYMPLSHKVKEIMESGIIGEPRLLTATLCYMMEFKERILRPDLCGGALLDLGVYALNFARMYFGTDIVKTVSNCQLGETGMDMQECISLCFADGKMANLQAGNAFAQLGDLTDILVANNIRRIDVLLSPFVPVPDMNVCTADRCLADLDQNFAGAGGGNGNLCQDHALNSIGLDQCIHHSCHVYTSPIIKFRI